MLAKFKLMKPLFVAGAVAAAVAAAPTAAAESKLGVGLLEQLRDQCKSLSASKLSTSLRVAVAGRKSQNMLIRPKTL